uniref:Ubiquitin-like protease family profile domain-containing protein n=1 Tax=Chenopodium quinoa TaxID=63459 RepID=A0A803MY27_CHEQI
MAKRTKKKTDPPKDIASPKKTAANKKVTAAKKTPTPKKTPAPKKSPAAKKSPTAKKVPANTKQSPIKGTKKRVKSELKDSNYEPEEDQNENSDGSSEEDRKKGKGHLKKKLKLDNSEHDVHEVIDINDVRSFKNNKNKDSRSGISGCVLILQLVYFHHLAFRGQPEPTTLPLIQHWTDEKVKERIAKEAKASFGQGELQKDDYPSCRKKGKEAFLGDVIENAYRNFSDREKRLVSFNLPEGAMIDSEIHEAAKDEIEEELHLLTRDSQLFAMMHAERIASIGEKMKKQKMNVNPSNSQQVSETQRLMEDPRVQRAMCEIVRLYDDIRDVSSVILSTWEEQHKTEIDPIEEDAVDPKTVHLDVDDEDFDIEDLDDGKKATLTKEATQKPIEVVAKKQLQEETTTIEYKDIHKEIVSKVKIRLDCGEKDVDIDFVCKTVKANKSRMNEMSELYQVVADYCFVKYSPFKHEEIVKFEGPLMITRDDTTSLAPTTPAQMIKSNIVQCWSFLMNDSRLIEDPSCFFFGIDHSRPLELSLRSQDASQPTDKIDVKSPSVHSQELNQAWYDWMCLCDAKEKIITAQLTIQYLDNREYDDRHKSFYRILGSIVVEEMSNFLKRINHEKVDEILEYEFDEVNFKWKTPRYTLDCGVFAMIHMLCFSRETFDSDLDLANRRKVYRAEICVALSLADINTKRKQLEKKISKKISKVMHNMSLQCHQVIDYLAINDGENFPNKSKVVGWFIDSIEIVRQDCNALLNEWKVSSNDALTMCLNANGKKGVTILQKLWIDWNISQSLDMDAAQCVYFPLRLEEHYFLAVINFKDETIDHLDITLYETNEEYEPIQSFILETIYDGANGIGLGTITEEFARLNHHHVRIVLDLLLSEKNQMKQKLLTNVEDWEEKKESEEMPQ